MLVEVNNIKKTYEMTRKNGFFRREKMKLLAINDVSFKIDEGEIFGLLGPNGAGKTTIVKILSTLLLPDEGQIAIGGFDLSEHMKIKKMIGVDFGNPRSLYWRLTAKENLELYGRIYGISRSKLPSRIDELLELVGLEDRANLRVETFSRGMIRRLQIARAIIHEPRLLLLDEPTLGLDVDIAKDIRRFIDKVLVDEKQYSVLLTTHNLSEAQRLCDNILIINKGKEVARGTPKELYDRFGLSERMEVKISPKTESNLKELVGNYPYKRVDGSLVVFLPTSGNQLHSFLSKVIESGHEINSVEKTTLEFEEIFMKIIEEDNK